jgi:transcriptional regulator with XRE-family HTH domain
VVIGQKLRELREAKNWSQGDIEHRTGLLRAYISRVENGHTIPTVGTLEKYARALGVPLYTFFIDDQPIKMPEPPAAKNGIGSQHGRELRRFAKTFKQVSDRGQKLLLVMAQKMAERNTKR